MSARPAHRDERSEADSMGEVRLPAWAYWGAQTQRAVENFGISSLRIPVGLIEALGLIKRYAAEVNGELGLLEPRLAEAVVRAADELLAGKWNEHFPIDVFQTGSGTSWNMNANELLANRANELLGSPLGSRKPVHPNDHVNRGQSSNDVIPAAIHIADRRAAARLEPELARLAEAFEGKAEEFRDLIKLGRTHLQDAVPMTLGQEFSGYAAQLRHALARLRGCYAHLEELALGGTAVGTGLNAHPDLAPRVVERIARHTGLPFRRADNPFEALACRDAQAALMAALDTLAGSLLKITTDLRLLAGGPRAGFGEIRLPSLQPGSSIMPGKVNPVIPEMVAQAAVYVKGKALSVSLAASQGPLELNIMMPLIAYETQESLALLAQACRAFKERCVDGLEADRERCAHWIEWSLALVTPLATRIGYDRAAQIAYQAYKEGKTVRQVALEQKVLSPAEIEAALDPRSMLGTGRG
jgi:fumarate hydratase class II